MGIWQHYVIRKPFHDAWCSNVSISSWDINRSYRSLINKDSICSNTAKQAFAIGVILFLKINDRTDIKAWLLLCRDKLRVREDSSFIHFCWWALDLQFLARHEGFGVLWSWLSWHRIEFPDSIWLDSISCSRILRRGQHLALAWN